MTYFAEPVHPMRSEYQGPTMFAHDDCLPADQFRTVQLSNGPHRSQIDPWRWVRVYGAPKPCHYCNRPTV